MSAPTNYPRAERAALCELLDRLGPEQPTLCAGWLTRDLAAHLILRERRPDAALGIMVAPLAGHTERVQRRLAGQPFADLVARVRRPPWWSPAAIAPLDRATNTTEFFIHHEDVRRARPDWQPRPLDAGLARELWSQLRMTAKLGLRRFPGTVTLAAPGHGELVAGAGGPAVRVTGDPGELILLASGRSTAAKVEATGDEALARKIREPHFGR